ncbi:M48 family metalloprotease [Rhodovulum sulfidophilum]|uniref:M48 family metalloprotease n=1 Tax=Rhodovulum sulfidophilum TaxID=35806 RepID=UPI00095300A0|nr:M48 family metalloprotease [Rhodovulum sulfidophilum]MBL3552157.1 M48 family metalloprotease [Rhodovulum sulfidophilum]OLS50335.1 peptidase M48 [Rhodovulum sulfidophilum]
MTGPARGLIGLALALILSFAPAASRAQSLIRDAEIEYALKRLTQPLAVAAGLSPERVRVMVLQDSSLNAFVLDSQTVMVHSGLLLRLESAAELQAVISHELAHIANGHITRRLSNMRSAGSAAAMGMLMSLAVAAAGHADAGAGIAMGSSSTAQRLFFAHTRAEEASADQAGARYMARAGISPQAMVKVLEIFRGQEALSQSRQDPYIRTHPLNADRLRNARGYASAYSGAVQSDPEADYWFARARGKLGAFLQNPRYTLRRAEKDKTAVGMMRRAVAWHRTPDARRAMAEIARLEAARGSDPFVQELKGQILLESRQFGPAVQAYARAVQMAPKEPLILAGYGRALLALDRPAENRKALAALEKARARDPRDPRMLRDLAVAYARTGNNGMASVATAERYAVAGRMKTAAVHARRAEGLLPRGSPGWLRADDILAAAEKLKQR